MTANPTPSAAEARATKAAEAWAVVEADGSLDPRNVSDTRRAAIINWLVTVCEMTILQRDTDDWIEKMWNVRKGDASAVKVSISLPPPEAKGRRADIMNQLYRLAEGHKNYKTGMLDEIGVLAQEAATVIQAIEDPRNYGPFDRNYRGWPLTEAKDGAAPSPETGWRLVAYRHRERPGFDWRYSSDDPARTPNYRNDEIEPLYVAAPAAPSPDLAALERAARAVHAALSMGEEPWDTLNEMQRDNRRGIALAALVAAQPNAGPSADGGKGGTG